MSEREGGGPLTVLVTGADGFVGRHLQQLLRQRQIQFRTAVRSKSGEAHPDRFAVGDIGPRTDWHAAVDGVQVVVHLAARAHILQETASDPRAQFMRVNAEGTATLATCAAGAGVRRLIYVSSIGVLGSTSGNTPFTVDSPPNPHNAYAESKLAGELAAQSADRRLEVTVLRLPLVYGPGVRANFYRLMRLVDSGFPLPFGAVANSRSLLNVENLCDLVCGLLTHPVAKNRTWLVSDSEDLSTPELIRRLAAAMRRNARLFAVPVRWLYALGRLTGREAQVAQLCGSLSVDSSRTRAELGWNPPVSVTAGLAATAEWYRAERHASQGQRA